MSSWEKPEDNELVHSEVKPHQRGESVGTVQKGKILNAPVLQVVELDQRRRPVGTIEKGEKKIKWRGWLALGVLFLTTAIGYGLMFLMIDTWFKG